MPALVRRPGVALAATLLLTIALAACSGAATSPSAAGSASPSVSAAASSAPPSVEPSSAAPASSAPASASSEPIPSFSLPSDDKELEGLLPDQICGADAFKLSMSGASFMTSADPEFVATLEQLGKGPDDVTFAVAGSSTGTCDEVAGVFRIRGADAGRLQAVFLEEAAKTATVPPPTSLGGKSVYLVTEEDANPTYAYFNGDAIFFVSAPDETTAAALLQQMP